MIVPSIDLMNGKAVQLVGGKGDPVYSVGDVEELARKFSRVGEIAVIDLDSALGKGSNEALIKDMCSRFPCRVGGGIRTVEKALSLLDSGAKSVIIGTKATPEFLSQLPRERVMAAVDIDGSEVLSDGWRTRTGKDAASAIAELAPYVSGFLVTFVDLEGRLGGTDLIRAKALVNAAGGVRITFAGGVTAPGEIAALDSIGSDAQVGMALYSGKMKLSDGFMAPVVSDRPDGLVPTVVRDRTGGVLGLVWSNAESVERAIETGRGVYWSRKRGLWEKGATSGCGQALLKIETDCDRDALLFTVVQEGSGFCHTGSRSCFGGESGLVKLQRTLESRLADAPEGSYTRRLFAEPGLLEAKILEEAKELTEARTKEETIWEAADLVYFALAKAVKEGVSLEEIERELDRRALKVTRRKGDAKPAFLKAANGTEATR